MALRVLLADNSETIKKVIQLTLQDFGLDLRIVTLGVDVIDVATQFRPDIIFVDILLQKKSGYEVSKEIKMHPQLKNTPVILMWSGFMEFDESKAKECLADARLEKPFEASQLRQLVQKLVKKSENNKLGNFLEFPDIPVEAKTKNDPLVELEKIKQESAKFEPSKSATPPPIPPPTTTDAEDFQIQTLDTDAEETALFKVDLADDGDLEDVSVSLENIEPIEDMSFLLNPKDAPKQKKEEPVAAPVSKKAEAPVPPTAQPQIHLPDQKMIEKMVHDKVSEIVEKIAWQLVPEVASQIIKKELDRLLKDNDTQV